MYTHFVVLNLIGKSHIANVRVYGRVKQKVLRTAYPEKLTDRNSRTLLVYFLLKLENHNSQLASLTSNLPT